MSKPKKPTKPKPESPLPSSQDTYALALNYLHAQIELIIAGNAPKTGHDPAYRVATLMQKYAQVEAERRKARAAENKRLEKVTRPLVIAWLRAADTEERRSVTREIATMEQEGSILA